MMAHCADTGLTCATCYCADCEGLRDRQSEIHAEKAHVMLAERPERERERQLLSLDEELRHLAALL
jgi:hypothetical protein